jgi:hypothetical protein
MSERMREAPYSQPGRLFAEAQFLKLFIRGNTKRSPESAIVCFESGAFVGLERTLLNRKEEPLESEMTIFQFESSPRRLNLSNRESRSIDRWFRRDLFWLASLRAFRVEASWNHASAQVRKYESAAMAGNRRRGCGGGRAADLHRHFRASPGNPGRNQGYRHRDSTLAGEMKFDEGTIERPALQISPLQLTDPIERHVPPLFRSKKPPKRPGDIARFRKGRTR